MIESLVDIWTEPADAVCITTNGFIKKNGSLVMGAGVAGQAQSRYPNFPKVAGRAVRVNGNIVMAFREDALTMDYRFRLDADKLSWFITFPVKHNWFEEADLELIERSSRQLIELLDEPAFGFMQKVLLPRPGCGNGRLKWSQVKPVIEPILDDRIVVVTNSLS